MNPGMSSWVGLRRRAELAPGESVLVLGATGNAGRMAVQIAKLLGAGEVVAAGRNAEILATLPGLGADRVVSLEGGEEATAALAEAAAEVDVVVDYLWGKPAEAAIPAIVRARTDRARALRWVQIGAITGPEIALPSAALRACNLKLMGSGQGSVSTAGIVEELPPWPAKSTPATSRSTPTRSPSPTSKPPGTPPSPPAAASSSSPEPDLFSRTRRRRVRWSRASRGGPGRLRPPRDARDVREFGQGSGTNSGLPYVQTAIVVWAR